MLALLLDAVTTYITVQLERCAIDE